MCHSSVIEAALASVHRGFINMRASEQNEDHTQGENGKK
jgi:hypothetical protein